MQSNGSKAASTFFDQGTVEEAIARIHFLIQSQRRLGTIIGPSGVGKSRLLQQFCRTPLLLSKLSENSHVQYVSIAGWSTNQFFRWVSNSVGHRADNCNLYQSAMDSISGRAALQGNLVLLIDDCDRASTELLHAVQAMSNSLTRLTLLLAATSSEKHPYEADQDPAAKQVGTTQSRFAFAALANQSQLRIELPAWNLGQTADYLSMMLESAGGRSAIFEAQAITRIHELANGLVKSINQIADLSLVAGAARRFARVPSELIDQICEELGLISGTSASNWSQNDHFVNASIAVGTKF